ncbi:MAG: hypothetical protein HRU80_02295 [Ignavibacteriales bacterium]|nr:MAG: hypothetical protein HRU80_02295 [Ignavibacteriales bacterium]
MSRINETVIFSNICYRSHPHHRNGANNKSQWTITAMQEFECFRRCLTENWIKEQIGWGLHFSDTSSVQYLGIDQNGTKQLFIAKFVGGQNWHGYPIDYQRCTDDIPDTEILNKWLNLSIFPPTKIRKITKGQPCSL